MKIAVTGATSFIGLNLLDRLIKDKNNDVIGVIRKSNVRYETLKQKAKSLKTVKLDLVNYKQLGQSIGSVDCLVYLTWNGTRGAARNDYELQKNNYEQGIKAVSSVLKTGCKKIITAGSQAEYGPWFEKRKITEEDIEYPNTEYGKFKLKFYQKIAELAEQNGETKIVEPRFFSLYGPHDNPQTMIISMLKNMLQNKPCDLTQSIQTWDFLYIDDAVDGLVKIIGQNISAGVYNFGSGESHPLKWYIEQMKRITKTKSELHYGAIPYPATGMVNVDPDVSKLMNIGWKPKISFEEGIKEIIESLTE